MCRHMMDEDDDGEDEEGDEDEDMVRCSGHADAGPHSRPD